jgi:myo-inositol-1-phosphate synthase
MPIRVAIVGVGNCAKSLVEGIGFYTQNPAESVGLMHPHIGRFLPSDITFVAAFDIDARKVGKPLHKAINAKPNKTMKIGSSLKYPTIVQRGPTYDSVIPQLREYFIYESKSPAIDLVKALQQSKVQIVVNYLPTGSDKATYAYAEAALNANCSFINCMPTPIAKDPKWRKRFEDKGLVLLGDDIKSQCGATIVNRALLHLLKIRGIKITKSDQTNYGGNADHFNLHYRPQAKEESKEHALKSSLTSTDAHPHARMIYTEKNYDHKQAKIKIEGKIWGKAPVSIDLTLEDEDSPNSAGVVVDAIRAIQKMTQSKKVKQAPEICAFLFKSPPKQYSDDRALERFNQIVQGRKGPF